MVNTLSVSLVLGRMDSQLTIGLRIQGSGFWVKPEAMGEHTPDNVVPLRVPSNQCQHVLGGDSHLGVRAHLGTSCSMSWGSYSSCEVYLQCFTMTRQDLARGWEMEDPRVVVWE